MQKIDLKITIAVRDIRYYGFVLTCQYCKKKSVKTFPKIKKKNINKNEVTAELWAIFVDINHAIKQDAWGTKLKNKLVIKGIFFKNL